MVVATYSSSISTSEMKAIATEFRIQMGESSYSSFSIGALSSQTDVEDEMRRFFQGKQAC